MCENLFEVNIKDTKCYHTDFSQCLNQYIGLVSRVGLEKMYHRLKPVILKKNGDENLSIEKNGVE